MCVLPSVIMPAPVKSFHDSRRRPGYALAPESRPARRAFSGDVQEILEGDRNAVQRTHALPRVERLVGELRGAARLSFIDLDEGVKPGIVSRNPLKIALKKPAGRRFGHVRRRSLRTWIGVYASAPDSSTASFHVSTSRLLVVLAP
jgi:hypothetical protein